MDTPRRTHPLIIVAAGTVSLFSLVGIAAVMGWIPTSTGQNNPSAAVSPVPEQPAEPAPPAVVERRAQPKPVARAEPRQRVQEAAITPPPPPPPPAVVAAICRECAVVEDVRTVEKPGQASGVGAVGGAVVGGVLGHQVGSGRGKDVATILGALGGAFGGNEVEKTVKKEKEYQILVRYDDGTRSTFTQSTQPTWHKGDRVRVINGTIQSNG